MSSNESVQSVKPAICALAALAIVGILFADVIFRGASLAPLDYDLSLYPDSPAPPPVSLYPETQGRRITDSWGDIGTASWQFEPAVRFMAHAMRSGESPWWNPYDGAGRMGPESLIDVPFSPITLAAALFGGGAASISFVLLALYTVTVFSVIRSLNRYLSTSFLAACTGAVAYLLNGFALCNLNTEIGQPYFLAPLVLLALLALLERPTGRRLALAAAAHALMFAVTLFPTMVLALISVHLIALVYQAGQLRARGIGLLLVQAAAPALAFGLVAFLYFPIFESLTYFNTVQTYSLRLTPGYSLNSALSLFTPKHFWQSYRAARAEEQWPAIQLDPWICHTGVLTTLVAASSVAWYRHRRTTLLSAVCASLVLISAGQILGVPPFTLIDRLPFFSFIRNEYWPALAGLPLAVLVAVGLDRRPGKWGDLSFAAAAVGIGGAFFFLLFRLRLPLLQPERGYALLFLLIFSFGCCAILALLLQSGLERPLRVALAIGIAAEGVYYMNSLHAVRTNRDTNPPASIQWVKDRIPSPAADRILNIGGSGLMPNQSAALQLPELGSAEFSVIPRYYEYFRKEIGRDSMFLTFFSPGSKFVFTGQSLSAAGVRFVIVDRAFTQATERLQRIGLRKVREDTVREVWENPNPRPRATLATQLIASEELPWNLPNYSDQMATTPDPHLQQEALRKGVGPATATGCAGTATIEEYHHTRVRIRTVCSAPSLLVLMDSWHPAWRARVDGSEAYVGVVNAAFRGVALAAGAHEVEFTYRPKTQTPGLLVSVLTLAITAGFFLYRPSLLRSGAPPF